MNEFIQLSKEKLQVVFDKFQNKSNLFPSTYDALIKPFSSLNMNVKCVFIVDDINESGIPLQPSDTSKPYPSQSILIDSLISDPYIEWKHPLTPSVSLLKWIDQGVLFFPSIFMAQKQKPSEEGKTLIRLVSEEILRDLIITLQQKQICYVLIGNIAKKYEKQIDQYRNLVIKLSSLNKYSMNESLYQKKNLTTMKIFTTINNFLISIKQEPIKW
jgi:uracil DNA glycosylase